MGKLTFVVESSHQAIVWCNDVVDDTPCGFVHHCDIHHTFEFTSVNGVSYSSRAIRALAEYMDEMTVLGRLYNKEILLVEVTKDAPPPTK